MTVLEAAEQILPVGNWQKCGELIRCSAEGHPIELGPVVDETRYLVLISYPRIGERYSLQVGDHPIPMRDAPEHPGHSLVALKDIIPALIGKIPLCLVITPVL
jgi:hypothetical protein